MNIAPRLHRASHRLFLLVARFFRRLNRHSVLIAALLSLAITAAYSSAVFCHYAWTDDFMTLYAMHSISLRDKIPPFYNVQGRPLGGLIVEAAFRAAWTLDGLNWVRAACLGSTLICGLILAAEFRRVTPGWIGVGAVSLLLLNPAAAVFVAWASSGLLSLPAATLALVGGVWWRRAFTRYEPRTFLFWTRIAGAGGLLLAALLIYQPCAAFFLLPAAIQLLDRGDAQGALRVGTQTAGAFTAICAGYFAVFQWIRPHLVSSADTVIYRADVVRDVVGRLRFYFSDVLPRTFEFWTVFYGSIPRGLALGLGLLLTLLFLGRLARVPGGRFVRLQAFLLVPVLFGLASSPLLVVKDSYAPFRTLAVLYSLVVVGLTGGVLEIWRGLPIKQRAVRTAIAVCWGGLIVSNGVVAGYVTKEGLVMRSVRELDLYRRFVRQHLADHPREVIFLLPYPQDVPRFSAIATQHEFGAASSSADWSFPGLFYFACDDVYRHDPAARASSGREVMVDKVPADGPALFPANVPVIDAAWVLKGSRSGDDLPRSGPVTKDDFFGEVQPLTPTLRLSRWFGLYEVLAPDFIRHHELGTLGLSGRGGEECWFYRDGLGWFWTGPKSFPFLYSGERKHWLWYVRGSRRPAELYDFDAPSRPRVLLE